MQADSDLHRPGGGTTSSARKTRDDRYEKFIAEVGRLGNVTLAARSAGISRRNAYKLRDEDEAFRADWDDAVMEYVEGTLEAEADRRGVEGTVRPVFYQGNECGGVREFSDTLLMFRLKAMAPEKYRHEAYIGVNATQNAMEIARQLREAHLSMLASVPAAPPDPTAVQEQPPAT